ncbi:39S ribosomal protein L54, mitochondrial-like [Penaeus japonicus]|uniref:39S ribosomal protein L54, mitochondrial-like n=1 Tax=Penaeus japonicus TaxID=27405 RepID=UPI001C70EB4A|nr:39S ribosomal protein L54, mitochondrial-like [Penaeus japonicus]
MALLSSRISSLSLSRNCLSLTYPLSFLLPTCTHVQHMNYAKPAMPKMKGKAKLGPAVEKVRLPVETDPVKLANFVCGSDPVKENPQDIKLKDDSEYPEWLWTLRTGKPPPLRDMDANTKQYWRRLRTMAMKEKNLLKKTRK